MSVGSVIRFKNSDLQDPEEDPAENGPDPQPCLDVLLEALAVGEGPLAEVALLGPGPVGQRFGLLPQMDHRVVLQLAQLVEA